MCETFCVLCCSSSLSVPHADTQYGSNGADCTNPMSTGMSCRHPCSHPVALAVPNKASIASMEDMFGSKSNRFSASGVWGGVGSSGNVYEVAEYSEGEEEQEAL